MQKFAFNKGKNIVFINGFKDPFSTAEDIINMLNDDNILIVSTLFGALIQFKDDNGEVNDINIFSNRREVAIYKNSDEQIRSAVKKTVEKRPFRRNND